MLIAPPDVALRVNTLIQLFIESIDRSRFSVDTPLHSQGWLFAISERAPIGERFVNQNGRPSKYRQVGGASMPQCVDIVATSATQQEAIERLRLLVMEGVDTTATNRQQNRLSLTREQHEALVNEAVDKRLRELTQRLAPDAMKDATPAAPPGPDPIDQTLKAQSLVQDVKRNGLQKRLRRKAVQDLHTELAQQIEMWNGRVDTMAKAGIVCTPPRKHPRNNKLDGRWLRAAQARWDQFLEQSQTQSAPPTTQPL